MRLFYLKKCSFKALKMKIFLIDQKGVIIWLTGCPGTQVVQWILKFFFFFLSLRTDQSQAKKILKKLSLKLSS